MLLGKKMNFKVCSVILYSGEAVKKAFASELQFAIIWLKLSPAPPVIINMQRKEHYLGSDYSAVNVVGRQHLGTLLS